MLRANATLVELKLTNQQRSPDAHTQRELAEAVEANGVIRKLAMDFTAASARDLFDRAISRNSYNAHAAQRAAQPAPRRARKAVKV